MNLVIIRVLVVIVHTFEICRASHVIKNVKHLCAETRVVMDLKISVFFVRSTKNIYLKFHVDDVFSF